MDISDLPLEIWAMIVDYSGILDIQVFNILSKYHCSQSTSPFGVYCSVKDNPTCIEDYLFSDTPTRKDIVACWKALDRRYEEVQNPTRVVKRLYDLDATEYATDLLLYMAHGRTHDSFGTTEQERMFREYGKPKIPTELFLETQNEVCIVLLLWFGEMLDFEGLENLIHSVEDESVDINPYTQHQIPQRFMLPHLRQRYITWPDNPVDREEALLYTIVSGTNLSMYEELDLAENLYFAHSAYSKSRHNYTP